MGHGNGMLYDKHTFQVVELTKNYELRSRTSN